MRLVGSASIPRRNLPHRRPSRSWRSSKISCSTTSSLTGTETKRSASVLTLSSEEASDFAALPVPLSDNCTVSNFPESVRLEAYADCHCPFFPELDCYAARRGEGSNFGVLVQ